MTKLACMTALVALFGGCATGEKAQLAACGDSCESACCAGEEGFISLFDGKSLDGWKANENPQTFRVENGELVVHGPRGHLFYVGPVRDADFANFHLKLQVMTKPKANSGVYFHTAFQPDGWPAKGFEAQVNTTHTDVKKTGGLYGVKDVLDTAPSVDNEWFDYDIIVQGKRVVLMVNGKVTSDWTETTPPKPLKGTPGRVIASGTFAIQGHDPQSEVHYKNIRVKPLP